MGNGGETTSNVKTTNAVITQQVQGKGAPEVHRPQHSQQAAKSAHLYAAPFKKKTGPSPKKITKQRIRLKVSVSGFRPLPHTPEMGQTN
jgi:hypothetical protein